jgi:hypothetical protein
MNANSPIQLTSFLVPPKLWAATKRHARQAKITSGEVTRLALAEYLAAHAIKKP